MKKKAYSASKVKKIGNDKKRGYNKKKTGRAKNHIKPSKDAIGDHSVIKRDEKTGEIINYATYTNNPKNPLGWQEVIRYDAKGRHYNKFTKKYLEPHIHDDKAPGKLRNPKINEIPKKPKR